MDTYHIFKKENKYFLKETSWFNMKSDYEGELRPELSEGITKAVWKSKEKIQKNQKYISKYKIAY